MKILFYIENLHSGGKERRLVELIKGLSHYSDIEMELVLTQKEIHYTEIYKTGIKIHYTIRKGLKKDPRLFWEFYKIARKVKPDIIHVWGNMVAFYAIPTKLLLGIPMINSQITDAPKEPISGLLGPKLPFYFSDKILSNSQAGIKAYKPPIKKSNVIYNGFDMGRLEKLQDASMVRAQLKIKTKYIVAMVATFSSLKDYKTYIKAALSILQKRQDVTFLAIGLGDSKKYQQMVPENLKEYFVFPGPQSQVESIMTICDIGVLATYTEGISNTIMEFMALGKPVIVSGSGGLSELILNNKTGFIVGQGDSESLAGKIEYLLTNIKTSIKMGYAAKNRIINNFNISMMVDATYMEYKKLCAE